MRSIVNLFFYSWTIGDREAIMRRQTFWSQSLQLLLFVGLFSATVAVPTTWTWFSGTNYTDSAPSDGVLVSFHSAIDPSVSELGFLRIRNTQRVWPIQLWSKSRGTYGSLVAKTASRNVRVFFDSVSRFDPHLLPRQRIPIRFG